MYSRFIFKLFEGIRESIKEKDPLKFILNKLNSFKKGKDSLKTEFGRASIDRTISTKKSTRFSDVITEDISSKIDTESKEKAKTIIDSTTDNDSLTEQEKLVLEKLREGKTKTQISKEMNIALNNVHKHVSKFIKKSNLTNLISFY